MIVRPAHTGDFGQLTELVTRVGVGLTTLAGDEDSLREKLNSSVVAFSSAGNEPAGERYLFVMEEPRSRRLVGVCAILAGTGLDRPFYSYRVGTIVHASQHLGVYRQHQALFLCNDHTGCSELSSLFLEPEHRCAFNGRLLARCRLLFMAEFRSRFSDHVIAELRGVSDDHGHSPFWEGLGRHFFDMEFSQADYISGQGNSAFIAELMPRHPIYATLLDPSAREVIGQVHPHTVPARRLLESEGFRYHGYVDIFDAGPTVEAQLPEIASVRHSRRLTAVVRDRVRGSMHLLANTRVMDFRCTLGDLEIHGNEAWIEPGIAAHLQVETGDLIRSTPLSLPTETQT